MTYKVFVKYTGGTGGQMLTMVLLSLMKPVEINSTSISTIHAPHITDLKHNFGLVWPPFMNYRQTINDLFTPDMNGNVKAEKLVERFKIEFLDTELPSYIIPTHWCHIHKMAPYIENSKFIDICANDNDSDQIAYNLVCKVFIPNNGKLNKNYSLFREDAKDILKRHNINTITDIDLTDNDTVRLITWLLNYDLKRNLTTLPSDGTHNNMRVNFRDIHTGNIVNQLDELAAFIGIEHLSDERRNNAIELINKYVAGQKDIPWKLSIDDY
jgi:hypothetical protein